MSTYGAVEPAGIRVVDIDGKNFRLWNSRLVEQPWLLGCPQEGGRSYRWTIWRWKANTREDATRFVAAWLIKGAFYHIVALRVEGKYDGVPLLSRDSIRGEDKAAIADIDRDHFGEWKGEDGKKGESLEKHDWLDMEGW